MSHSERIETVFDAHDLGLRTLAELEGRMFRPHSREQKKRRRAVGEALRSVGLEVARLAARNLPLSKHHRGENDRETRYLDVEYALRRPEAIAELFEGSDAAFPEALRRSLGGAPEREDGGAWEIEEFERARVYVANELRLAIYDRLLAEHDHRIDVDHAPIPDEARQLVRGATTEDELNAALEAGLRSVETMDLAPVLAGG